MSEETPAHIHIVDDEPGVRETIAAILRLTGFITHEYATADELLAALDRIDAGCIITDVNMPGMNGLDLVRHLRSKGVEQPVIVISGEADVPMAVQAMKAGAIEFLEKPIRSAALQEAVAAALGATIADAAPDTERYLRVVESLTRRQREVLTGILDGLPNKLIAYRLGLSIRTVEAYRAAIMDRTGAKNLSELVRLGVKAGL